MKTNLFLSVIFLFIFSSCASLMSFVDLGTSEVSPEKRAKIKKLVSDVGFKKIKKISSSGIKLRKLKKGQWITTLTTDKGKSKELTLATTKVIRVKGSEVTLEIETFRASNDAVMELSQITFKNYPLYGKVSYSKDEVDKFVDKLEIIKVLNKDENGTIHETPKHALMMMKGANSSYITSKVSSGKVIRKRCKTDYVKSSGCYYYNMIASAMGMSVTSSVVAHNKIPITGQISSDCQYTNTQTIAFGFSGAKSKFK